MVIFFTGRHNNNINVIFCSSMINIPVLSFLDFVIFFWLNYVLYCITICCCCCCYSLNNFCIKSIQHYYYYYTKSILLPVLFGIICLYQHFHFKNRWFKENREIQVEIETKKLYTKRRRNLPQNLFDM